MPRRGVVNVAIGLLVAATARAGADPPRLTHGVAVGEVRATSAVVWGRCDRAGTLRVALDGHQAVGAPLTPEHDFTGKVMLSGLEPATDYGYRTWCEADGATGESISERGAFRTAPPPEAVAPLRFAWGGDLAGQNVCRDLRAGFPIFAIIARHRPDFFIGLGDMIYADDVCGGIGRYGNAQVAGPGPAATLETYWAHWRYGRDDREFQRLLAQTSYYAIWDDHEVVDDFGPRQDTRPDPPWRPDLHLLPLGRAAFLDYAPMIPPTPARLSRSVRWGRHLELFLLDARQFRDPNRAEDTAPGPKSMLGASQRDWLERGLETSHATWKVVVSSVPMSIPTGSVARDGWADHGTRTGFERELVAMLRTLERAKVQNVLWITTDVHFAAVFRYRPFPAVPAFKMHEIATGPLNAGVFSSQQVDETLRPERLFSHGPAVPESVTSFEQALGWFNFGLVEIGADGTLAAEIVDARGTRLYRLELPATAP